MPTLRTRVSKPLTKKRRKKPKKKKPKVTDAQLKRRYRDPQQPGSLGGVARFAKAQGITVQRAKRVLAHELGYTLHKPARRHFPTLRVLVFGPDEQWAADLVDVQKLKKQNKGVNYLLTVVDVFSKYAWSYPSSKRRDSRRPRLWRRYSKPARERLKNSRRTTGRNFTTNTSPKY